MRSSQKAEIRSEESVDQMRFRRLCELAMPMERASGEGGIGTLQEKRMHSIIKRYLNDDEDYHEVGIPGTRYVADVEIGNGVFEVQTGSLYPMRKKLEYYLSETDRTVTVVHPVPAVRWMSWIDPKSGDISPRRKVTPGERLVDFPAQLYCILPLLQNPRLQFRLLVMEVWDFRFLNGRGERRKQGSTRYERFPLSLAEEIELTCPQDFLRFVPENLPEWFTVRDYADRTHVRGVNAYSAVRVLTALGLFAPAEKIGRSMAFRRIPVK